MVDMDDDVLITIYDKDFNRTGWLSDPVSMTATARFNAVGTATILVEDDHPKVELLTAKGARVVIEYKDEHFLSGPVRLVSGTGPAGMVTVTVEDDLRLLWNVLGWPNPTGLITEQGAATSYKSRSGTAEWVLKTFVTENAVTRLGLPLTVGMNESRGETISVQMRMHPLADRLFPAFEEAGLGVFVKQSGGGLLLDVFEPYEFPVALSVDGGTVLSYEYSHGGMDATRTVIGGQGEGTSREFRIVKDSGWESTYGALLESFTDARDLEVAAEIDARGREKLDETGPRSSLRAELSESGIFRFGPGGINLGDRVTVEVTESVSVTEVVREAQLSLTRDAGLVVTPVIGERADDPDRKLAKIIQGLAKASRSKQVDYDSTVSGPDAVWEGPVTGPVEGGFEGEWID